MEDTERDEQLIQGAISGLPSVREPKCPGCGKHGFRLSANVLQNGPWNVALVWCAECGHVLQAAMMGVSKLIERPNLVLRH